MTKVLPPVTESFEDCVQALQGSSELLPESLQESHSRVLGSLKEIWRRRNRVLDLVKEALSDIRLEVKYLIFDLEATRNERDLYRAKLKKHGIEPDD